jgi:ketosteroid isomerase-like protein
MYRNIVSLKRFQTVLLSLGIAAGSFCPPLTAQEVKGWQPESLHEDSRISKPDLRQIDEALLKMFDGWNAHDIERYLELYRKSPELLVIVDSEQFNGWQQFHDSYINGYPDRNTMGFIEPKRIQIKMLKPDFALALTWWSISFSSSKQKMVGNTTMDIQKFGDGWKIVASHTTAGGT